MAFKPVKEAEEKELIDDEPQEVEEVNEESETEDNEENSENQLVDILNEIGKRISALEAWAFRVKQA